MKKEALSGEELAKEKERMVRELKKAVKQVMEESVAKKTVHEESSNVSAVCSIVDNCLALGLRRRALGLFKTSSSIALLQKISRENPDAGAVMKRIDELESRGEGRRKSSSSSDSIISFSSRSTQRVDSSSNLVSSSSNRFYWIRIALFEKKLHRILSYLTQNSDRFYDCSKSLIGDPDYGPLLSSLLVGPCALEYSRVSAHEQYWHDPPADELVQRHRISSLNSRGSQPATPNRGFKRMLSSYESEERRSSIPHIAREYVESLHQNRKSALLYGKNNINVLQRNSTGGLPGYLSLHQDGEVLTLKWTPNSLMDARSPLLSESSSISGCSSPASATWLQALQVNLSTILYIHSHQDTDTGGTLVMVGRDGIQYPPMHFPPGESTDSFLDVLESALQPKEMLDPPLGGSKDSENLRENGKDIVYKIRPTTTGRKSSDDGLTAHDSLHKTKSLDWLANFFHISKKMQSLPAHTYMLESEVETENNEYKISPDDYTRYLSESSQSTPSPSTPIKGLCRTMKNQLISRAFYGWLAHCRHMKTVRTHLSGLVLPGFDPSESESDGLTVEAWTGFKLQGLGSTHIQNKIYRLIYNGGMEHELRKEVWPYLLGHLNWNFTSQQVHIKDGAIQSEYERKISEWGALEAIVLQQDREINAANIARVNGQLKERSDSTSSYGMPNNVYILTVLFCRVNGQLKERSDSTSSYGMPNDVYILTVLFCRVNGQLKERSDSTSSYGMPNDVFESVDDLSETPDRPSTITEVTEQSSTSRSRVSEDSENSGPRSHTENKRAGKRDPILVSASDEGIEDLNDEDETYSIENKYDGDGFDGYRLGNPRKLSRANHDQGFGFKITTPSIDSGNPDSTPPEGKLEARLISRSESDEHSVCGSEIQEITRNIMNLSCDFRDDLLAAPSPVSLCPSPASSEGGTYTMEILEKFGLNLHRIEKDVARCDRNLEYFSQPINLEKLRNVITTYVWENLEDGYMQGMCDLVAPLLVVIDDEAIVYSCFTTLMKRMIKNFPTGEAMDSNFGNMRALMQVLDQSLYDTIQQNGDFSHFYFCYRWFLLDFKREFEYSSVYLVWETIWAAARVSTEHFYLFIALGLVETYRDIILDRNMDFTDIIKFFNEMAERHQTDLVLAESKQLLNSLRNLVHDTD
ncbi:small G protein signaling modulator 2 isoform X2 [Eurytemora carolleeae]|uniref:small G protein signaling modulator 2 isoform X2 n=1 Tax=Eurytemora carolleeae TaxID=1294199 RepID=UPI000C75E587|nr:small G protein signaling modulator 2 isoform X2 [Eurytemora carolleeae]|eukprot:XP_023324524.1 small G protein signaling modulator 2-like isoform X2 [Eurytemora affinis]